MNKITELVKWDFKLASRSIKSVFSHNVLISIIQKLIFCWLIIYVLSAEYFTIMICNKKYGFYAAEIVSELFTLIFTSFWTLLLFSPKMLENSDFDLLSSLPIKKSTLLKARMIFMGLFLFFLSLLGIIPGLVYAGIKGSNADFGEMVLKNLILFFIVTTFLMLIISFCKLICEKNRIGKIFSVLIILSIIFFYAFKIGRILTVSSKDDQDIVGSILNQIRCSIFPFFVINSENLVSAIILSGFAGIIFLVLSFYFVKIYHFLISKNTKSIIKKKNYSTRKVDLFRRELWVIKNYKGYMPHFIMETFLAPVIIGYLLGLIKIVGKYSDKIGPSLNKVKDFEYGGYIVIMVISVIILSQSGCLAPVSREGKLYYITRILPIPSGDIYKNKFMISFFTSQLSALLSYIVLCLLNVVKINGIISTYLILSSGIFACLTFASITDYLRPFISWSSVKMATNGNINVLLGWYKVFLFFLVESMLFVFIKRICYSILLTNIIITLILLIFAIFSYRYIKDKISYKYKNFDVKNDK